MDRCALFVDAGHLLAQAGVLCCGTYKRGEIICKYQELISALAKLVTDHSQLPLLRTYWYDGAEESSRISSLDHRTIASLPDVKVRLGRLSVHPRTGQVVQKGVDALIYRDIMTLARERAMATGYLLTGDEDLREGIVSAQEVGVRVVLLGVFSERGYNQSQNLVREADEHTVIEKAFWSPYFSPITLPPATATTPPQRAEMTRNARLAAREFAGMWVESAPADELRRLIGFLQQTGGTIPADLDAQLIQHVQSKIAETLEKKRDIRREVRAAFRWAVIESVRPEEAQGPHPQIPPS